MRLSYKGLGSVHYVLDDKDTILNIYLLIVSGKDRNGLLFIDLFL